MNRREFLHRASMLAALGIAAEDLDLIERLGWKRTLFPSVDLRPAMRTISFEFDLKTGTAWMLGSGGGKAFPMRIGRPPQEMLDTWARAMADDWNKVIASKLSATT